MSELRMNQAIRAERQRQRAFEKRERELMAEEEWRINRQTLEKSVNELLADFIDVAFLRGEDKLMGRGLMQSTTSNLVYETTRQGDWNKGGPDDELIVLLSDQDRENS